MNVPSENSEDKNHNIFFKKYFLPLFLGEIGVFAMASLVPEDEPSGEEDHAEDDQHEQQDERAQPEGEGLQESSCQCARHGR